MPSEGKQKKERGTNKGDNQNQSVHDLMHLLNFSGKQTMNHPLIRKCNSKKHDHRQHSMHKISKVQLVLAVGGHGDVHGGVENLQAGGEDEAVDALFVGAEEAVGELREEAESEAESKEHVQHGDAEGGARAVSVDGREDGVEDESSACWEKIGELGGC